ncbi:MAG: hypothetical protein IPM43_03840 [Actinomycetota bacterium]|nr:MAG: hypothetical protein IPM43_03840 [Actinomycetota bacterium]
MTAAGGALGRSYHFVLDRLPVRWQPAMRRVGAVGRSGLHRSRHLAHRVRRALRPVELRVVARSSWWSEHAPHIVPVPGRGPVVLVDARGHQVADVVERLGGRAERMVVLVDDPQLAPLRAAQLVYEYVPAVGVAGVDAAAQQHLVNERRPWLQLSHGIEREVDLDGFA